MANLKKNCILDNYSQQSAGQALVPPERQKVVDKDVAVAGMITVGHGHGHDHDHDHEYDNHRSPRSGARLMAWQK
jgi:hypothetical protein